MQRLESFNSWLTLCLGVVAKRAGLTLLPSVRGASSLGARTRYQILGQRERRYKIKQRGVCTDLKKNWIGRSVF